ncbi:MAG TPA: transcriptional repressor LexA [Candidatus Magasanikbacteria bacterium]|nr:transcriptional repressor LexA [Candidatus Magasanikbacteria bacterium]
MKKSSIGIGKPTKREAEILQFAREYRQENGFSPSLVEIAKFFKRSVPTIHQHVYSLRSKNLLLVDKGKKRSINALHNHRVPEVMIPLMGIISAGGPIEAIRDPKPIEVPRSMLSLGHDYYALKVSGLSMIEEGISDGDIVVVRDQQSVDDGEKAVAYMPDRNEVTLKKIYREKDRIKLVPANQTMKPFYESNVVIQGKVVGVLRKEF